VSLINNILNIRECAIMMPEVSEFFYFFTLICLKAKFVFSRSKKYNLPYSLDEKKILSYVLSWTTSF
jgi:hypothetical protein